jgi:hypothetical protein
LTMLVAASDGLGPAAVSGRKGMAGISRDGEIMATIGLVFAEVVSRRTELDGVVTGAPPQATPSIKPHDDRAQAASLTELTSARKRSPFTGLS